MANHWKVLIAIWLCVLIAVGFRAIQKGQSGDRIQQVERAK